MNWLQRFLHRPGFIRLFNWEYWSFGAVYTWIYPVWLYYCLRARSFFFFAASNPGIKNGGFLNESKEEIVAIIPEAFHPKTVFFSQPANADIVLKELQQHRLAFPLIGKPNVGGRGRGVKVIRDEGDVRDYVHGACLDFHIQEYVPYKEEVGIFYYRYPEQERGEITGIVKKEFLSVTGDGTSSILQLLQRDKRALMYLPALRVIQKDSLDLVLPQGERRIVSPFGNHARGSKFLDHSHLIDETLTNTIDALCKQIPGFYFGRLDIRYRDWESFKQGQHFAIIEVNGAGSEPTHIYDPSHSLFFAWKEIIRHWAILYKVSRKNHGRGHPYLTFKEGVTMFRESNETDKKLARMSE